MTKSHQPQKIIDLNMFYDSYKKVIDEINIILDKHDVKPEVGEMICMAIAGLSMGARKIDVEDTYQMVAFATAWVHGSEGKHWE